MGLVISFMNNKHNIGHGPIAIIFRIHTYRRRKNENVYDKMNSYMMETNDVLMTFLNERCTFEFALITLKWALIE